MERDPQFYKKFLEENNVKVVVGEPLPDLDGFVVSSLRHRLILQVNEDIDDDKRSGIYLQALAHLTLGHFDSLLANIIFPKAGSDINNKLTEKDVMYMHHASDLVDAFKSETVDKLWERPDFQIMYSSRFTIAQVIQNQLNHDM